MRYADGIDDTQIERTCMEAWKRMPIHEARTQQELGSRAEKPITWFKNLIVYRGSGKVS